ncbi:hypothetical protein [Streptomyces erythrochromogenes]|uniref:hypothetical protein n=1 Tax=Streptomyces erythrochromogenes TaxID=285574 RepID=UPI00367EABAD
MGNSTAYAVFRTGDAATAYAKARELCALLSYPEDLIWVSVELLTVEDVRRMAAVLPEARFGYLGIRTGPEGEDLWFDLDVMTADDRALKPHLPLEIMGERVPAEVAERCVAALGGGMADIEWHGSWPDEPEADRYGNPKCNGVQVLFHGDDVGRESRTDDHTVFVHVRGAEYLSWACDLAARIGGEVLGGPQIGW